jgi:uncharacterized protein YcsI (UPF0317 family)
LIAVPRALAADFHRFCDLNPRPCPLLAVAGPGDSFFPTLGEDIDARTDLPRYRVWRDGVAVDERFDATDQWRDDLATFILGCSFSFEEALATEGLSPKHVTAGTNVPMYRTTLACASAGPFRGPLVVSMRPYRREELDRVVAITARFPLAHGAPVHLGRPDLIGVGDLAKPWAGDATEVREDELPVFWACGITPQSVVLDAKPSLCITHAPGHMLVTDLENATLAQE